MEGLTNFCAIFEDHGVTTTDTGYIFIIWGSHSGDYEEFYAVGYNTQQSSER
jgi:hypothetical protein